MTLDETAASVETIRDKANSVDGVIGEQKGRLDAAISTFQSQFSDSENGRRQEHDNRVKELEVKATNSFEETNQTLDAFILDSQNTTHSYMDDLRRMRDTAADILSIIGNIGVSGEFQKNAEKEGKAANVFRWISLAAMILIVAGVVFTLYGAFDGKTWQNVLMRIGITLALAIPAAYTARESEKHRQLERRYKRLELELSSIDAYLQPLPNDERDKVRIQLAAHYFGQKEEDTKLGKKDKDQFANSIVGLMGKIFDEYTNK